MEPLISILVPVFNMEAYLHRCISSLLTQDYPHLEIILLDDGSTDASLGICREYAAADARVKVFHQSNSGLSASRNALLSYAHGEYLAFVDADDWVEPDYISSLYALCNREHALMSACNHYIMAEDHFSTRSPAKGDDRLLSLRQADEGLLYHGIPDVSAWGKLYHRDLFNALRYPAGRLYEDTYLIAELVGAANGLAYTPRPLYRYCLRPDSISRDVYRPSKLDFLWAADHLCEVILSRSPMLESGAVRRKVHAALSVRRYFVDCDPTLRPARDRLEETVKRNARAVLQNPLAPRRDRLGVLAVLLGPNVYDLFWKIYSKRRKQW